ncbi:MAG: TnpV protein [Lachnospiraceae bacterium]|nr:TnpV protein [Lachnospiraceae bacterium]
MKLTYHKENGYLLPNLIAPDSPSIGVWGMRRLAYLRRHRRPIYSGMLMDGTLNAHMEEIDRAAEEMMELLMTQTAEREGVTEQLKAEDQMAWVQTMNSIRSRAEEIVLAELIFDESEG